MRKLIAILILSSVLAPISQGAIFRSGEGWFTSSDQEDVSGNAPQLLEKAESYEAEGNPKDALAAYRTIARKYPKSEVAPRAQLKMATLLEQNGDMDAAFKAYGDYLTKYPKGEDFDKAVEAQFKIARLFLGGEKQKLLGVPTTSSMSRAQAMFEEIIKNAPYSQYAPLAQFDIGQALEKQKDYPKAIAAYQKVLSNYPNDPVAADAQYQIGYVHMTQSMGTSYDQAASAKARVAFEDFVARYPESEKVAQAKENLNNLSTTKTSDSLNIAKFYDKQKKYKAAVIYYNQVIKQQPDSPASEEAKSRIDELVNLVGEDDLRPGPERTETGARARQRRKFQSQVDTSSRPDYLGPPVVIPDELPPEKPKLRTSPNDIGPVPAVEPDLPSQ